jgi:L-threonylcarbamoyladenylate synthase
MRASSSSANRPETPAIAAAADALRHGGVVVYPTETLYGLGVDATNPTALARLVALKGREPGKPISVLVADETMLSELAAELSPLARRLVRRFWPGPLTLVLPAHAGVSDLLTGGTGTIGVRVSSHPVATALVVALGRPVTSPSANPAGCTPPVTVDDARGYFGTTVDAYLDAGRLPGEPASTVVDVRDGLRVVREGAVPAALLRAAA